MNKNLNRAIEIVKNGGIIIFPTDTAFGIGCRIDREDSINRLFEIRKRPKEKAVPVLASSIRMVEEYVESIDSGVRKLMRKYWPGGLTLVLHSNEEKVPSLVRGGGDTIGVRIPAHQSVLRVVRAVGVPILAPSANLAGGKTPFRLSEIDRSLIGLVDYVVPGRCKIKEVSTIIDCTSRPWRIVRQGAVKVSFNETI